MPKYRVEALIKTRYAITLEAEDLSDLYNQVDDIDWDRQAKWIDSDTDIDVEKLRERYA